MRPYSYRDDPAVPSFPDDKPIIVFDGYCALCSGWAAFVLRHDPDSRFRLLSAQSPLGHALYVHYGLDPEDYETNILIANGHAGPGHLAALEEAAAGVSRRHGVTMASFTGHLAWEFMRGRYAASVMRLVRLGGVLTVLALGSFVLVSLRRERAA